MDSEVSLIMANQVLASSGKVIWDPFGSSLLVIYLLGLSKRTVVGYES